MTDNNFNPVTTNSDAPQRFLVGQKSSTVLLSSLQNDKESRLVEFQSENRIHIGFSINFSTIPHYLIVNMKINKKLLPVKAHFFFGLAAAAPVFPFLPLIIKELGFSATAAGTIGGIVPVVCMFAKPWAGAMADRFKIHKALLVFLVLANACLTLLIRYVPPLPMDRRVVLTCNPESTQVEISTNKAGDSCFFNTLAASLNTSRTEGEFIAREWQGEFFHELNQDSGSSLENSSKLASGSMYITLHSPYRKDNDVIAIHVQSIMKSQHIWTEPTCSNSSELTGEFLCSNPLLHEIITKSIVQDSEVFNYSQYWILLIVVLGCRVLGSCMENLADSVCFKLLEDNPHNYGVQRMWGSAGWGLMSFIVGALVDRMSVGKATNDRSIAFYLGASIGLIDALVCLKFKVKDVRSTKNKRILTNVKKLVGKNPKFLVFLVLVTACGVFSSFVWNFLFWLVAEIVKEDGCTDKSRIQTLNGLILSVNCYLGEIPFFFLSGWFLKKFGYEHCMTMVLIAFGVRFILYYFLVNPWWILPIEILNGICFGLFYATMTTYANALTPPGLEGTMQGLVSAAFEGIGITIGAFFGGYLFDKVGGRTLFLFGGAAAIFLAAAHSALLLVWTKSRIESPPDADDSDECADFEGMRIPPEQNHIADAWS